MQIKTILWGALENNTYVVISDDKAIIIDAACPAEEIEKYTQGKQVVGVLITHGHFDHIQYLDDIVNKFGVKCYMHKLAYEKLSDGELNASLFALLRSVTVKIDEQNCVFVKEGDKLNLIKEEITVVETPGHTSCGVCYVADQIMFSGDTIFKNCIGRTDVPTSDYIQMQNSIKKLLTLYKNHTIYAGHGPKGAI